MYEIEMKARVTNPESLLDRLRSMGCFLGSCEKTDFYWALADYSPDRPDKKFRLRKEGDVFTVTYKEKRVVGEIEINEEREFQVSSPEVFLELMGRAGSTELMSKRKRVEKFRVGRCLVEAVHVEGLGDFVEIEILAEDAGTETVRIARQELFSVLERCGIGIEEIETRFYSDLLAAKKGEVVSE